LTIEVLSEQRAAKTIRIVLAALSEET